MREVTLQFWKPEERMPEEGSYVLYRSREHPKYLAEGRFLGAIFRSESEDGYGEADELLRAHEVIEWTPSLLPDPERSEP
jgi:hypothetical protein